VYVYNTYTDEELVQRLANNDRQAFEQLYERYWFELYQTGFAILKDADAVKDVVQDVFVWLWENRTTVHITYIKAYLKAAIRFKIANYIRSGNIRETFFDELARVASGAFPATGNEMVELKELQQVIHDSISQLPEKCREVYRLSREEGLTNREIAERLGISVKTVEAQMTIALKRLRTELGPRLVYLVIFYYLS
jgi:RNA polymerase sigma-70 factor (ECF subfamily)